MKYAIILGDGMADYKIPSLAQKTPLQAARKPFIDALAKKSELFPPAPPRSARAATWQISPF